MSAEIIERQLLGLSKNTNTRPDIIAVTDTTYSPALEIGFNDRSWTIPQENIQDALAIASIATAGLCLARGGKMTKLIGLLSLLGTIPSIRDRWNFIRNISEINFDD